LQKKKIEEEEEEEEEGRLKRLCGVMFSRWLVVFEISSVWMM
jgi:hypothetical protein